LLKATTSLGIPVRVLGKYESPYIELHPTWEALLAALPKKMRWTIRKSEKDLSALGSLTYEEVTAPEGVASLLAAIYEIEQKSWKEQSGTSITAQAGQREFYESCVAQGAQAGILSAHVLRLDGKPIAYILGIAAGDGVFLDQKESFDLAYSEHSPGHVLKHFAIERLLARGVKLYDLMGECEQYKMRWTSKTYTRLSLALYNRNLGGRLSHLRSMLRR
jgi:CelD/BcsL family acetyltransferase involved in cellulose biosynthesis